jgi:hypothetical protein
VKETNRLSELDWLHLGSYSIGSQNVFERDRTFELVNIRAAHDRQHVNMIRSHLIEGVIQGLIRMQVQKIQNRDNFPDRLVFARNFPLLQNHSHQQSQDNVVPLPFEPPSEFDEGRNF